MFQSEMTLTISEWRKRIKLQKIYQELEEIIKLLGVKEIYLRSEAYEDVHEHLVISTSHIDFKDGKWIYVNYSSGGGWIGRSTLTRQFDTLYDAIKWLGEPEAKIHIILRQVRKALEEKLMGD